MNPVFQEMQSTQEIQEIQDSDEEEYRIIEVCATTTRDITFKIPEGLNLLSAEESEECKRKKPFSWWIRRDKLFYLNADGKVKRLEYSEECTNKEPDDFEVRYASD